MKNNTIKEKTNKPIHITIPPDLNAEIEDYRDIMKEQIGFKPNVSDTIRHLIRATLSQKPHIRPKRINKHSQTSYLRAEGK